MTITEKQVIREKITATSSEELIEKLVNMVNEFPYADSVNMHICAIISDVPYRIDDNGASLTHQHIMTSPLPAHALSL
jgi:hypothetical protein